MRTGTEMATPEDPSRSWMLVIFLFDMVVPENELRLVVVEVTVMVWGGSGWWSSGDKDSLLHDANHLYICMYKADGFGGYNGTRTSWFSRIQKPPRWKEEMAVIRISNTGSRQLQFFSFCSGPCIQSKRYVNEVETNKLSGRRRLTILA